jgi:hypothetical protein
MIMEHITNRPLSTGKLNGQEHYKLALWSLVHRVGTHRQRDELKEQQQLMIKKRNT